MEYDIVLADEVDDACLGIFPPSFPAVGIKLLGVGYIADRSIEPHVEDLAFGAFDGNGYTPRQVAAHGTWLQTHVEP